MEENRPVSAVKQKPSQQLDLQMTIAADSAVESALKKLDLNTLTPLEALNKLYELKAMI